MITKKGITDESFDGCNDLTRHDNEKWFALGGADIVVWGNDWTIYADDQAAIDYIASVYNVTLSNEE